MREIEFRGKDIETGKWVFGDLHTLCDKPHIHTDKSKFPYAGKRSFVIPETIGQFTGLLDKNGKKMYEGDIIFAKFSDKSCGYCLVGWNEETSSFGLMDSYSYEAKREGYDFPEFKNDVLLAFLEKTIVFEVSGNIHETPELLENK